MLHGSGGLISPKEAAARLGIKRCTVYRLCAKGELPHVRVGSLLRIDVDAYLAAHGKGYGGAARKRSNSRARDGARSVTTSQTMRSSIPK